MKVKELEKTVNLVWSPKAQYPILIAAGTAAQQVDASFSTNAELEIFSINLGDPSQDLELRCTVPSDYRFHKLVWGGYGYGEDDQSGLIVGGCDVGRIIVYNASKLLKNDNGIVKTLDGHSGSVKSLDFNPFQKNLLASGASKSEIYIWDMNNLTTPMTPGKAAEPLDDIISLAWNKQVQHILTTTFSTRCLVWDLKKNEPIIKLTDPTAKSRWKVVTWDPQVATQLCLASEDDHYPVVQLWDLRYATTPVKIFEGHQKGVLSVAWCDEDPDLLVSCGKDNKLLVWNPNTNAQVGEIVCDMTISTQWNFEVNWCPRNPFLVSTTSFDGRASIHSLSGGKPAPPTANKIADSFPGVNAFPIPSQQMNQQQQSQQPPVIELRKPPRWIKKCFGVSFGFGGKLVTFGPTETTVYVSQVVTEPELMLRYKDLEDVLEQGNVFNHCYIKAEQTKDAVTREVWKFIACQMYGAAFKDQAIMFLGCSIPQLNEKLKLLNMGVSSSQTELSTNETPSHISRLGPADGADIFDNLVAQQQNSSASSLTDGGHDFEILKNPLKFPQNNDLEVALCEALILGHMETAVDLLIHLNRWMDALVLSLSAGAHLVQKTKDKYFKKSDNSLTSLIGAIINEDWCNVVETCELSNWRQVLVTLLSYTRDDELRNLCAALGHRLLSEEDEALKKNALICFVCAANVNLLIEHWGLNATTTSEVHELVELALIMKEASKTRGITADVSGALANVIVNYAELLASQGYLTAAYTYLGDSNDARLQELKNRLMCALELKSAYQSRPQQFSTNSSYFGSQKPQQSRSNIFPITATGAPTSVMPPLLNQLQPLPATDSVASFHQPPSTPSAISNSHVHNSLNNAPPTTGYPSAMNLFSGPPSTSPASSIASVSASVSFPVGKVINPSTSVFSSSTTSTFTSLPPPSNQATSNSVFTDVSPLVASSAFLATTSPVMPRSTPTPPGPPPPASSQVPCSSSRQTTDPVITSTKSRYVVDPSVQGSGPFYGGNFPAGGYPNGQPIMNHSQPSQKFQHYMGQANETPSYSMLNQSPMFQPVQQNVVASYNQNLEDSATGIHGIPSVQAPKVGSLRPSTPGWNDPPSVFYDKPSKSQLPVNTTANYSAISAPFTSIIQSAAPPQMPADHAKHYGAVQNSFQCTTSHPGSGRVSIAEEAIPKQKPPLPEEHIHLQTVLDELRNRCLQKTNNQQMKRKLIDVSRKLDMLYDTIRDGKLSPQTLSGLHEIINAIQHHNYMNCLDLHTQLVSGSDFATIASFMPGIKVLVQSAIQLQVYL